MLGDFSSIATLVTIFTLVAFFIAKALSTFKYDENITTKHQMIFTVIAFCAFSLYHGTNVFFNNYHEYSTYELVQCAEIAVVLILGLIFYYHTISKYSFENKGTNISKIIEDINNNNSSMFSKVDGVFAVSALIFTNDNRIILTQRKGEDKWIQPGTYIRTNKIYKKDDVIPEFKTPQQQLLDRILHETGINAFNLEYIDVFSTSVNHDFATLRKIENPDLRTNDLKDNLITPSPFLIQFEHSDSYKTSQTHTHIDMFYIFKLKDDVDFTLIKQNVENESSTTDEYQVSKIESFTLSDIREKVSHQSHTIYADMLYICEYAMKCYIKFKHNNNISIRHCTFNTNNNILWIRTSNNCNGECRFCLMSHNRQKPNGASSININSLFDTLRESRGKIKKGDLKLIISGGEPFIIDNLIEKVVSAIIEMPEYRDRITKLSICTNGTLCSDDTTRKQIMNLYKRCIEKEIRFKLVLDLPGYEKQSYKYLTRLKDSDWDKLDSFIDYLNKEGIPYCANVILSKTFEKRLDNYIAYWARKKIKYVTLSYVIRNKNNENSLYLTKDECIAVYKKIVSGEKSIDFIRSIDLAIPECNDNYCESDNIFTIYYDYTQKKYIGSASCLDKAI